MLKTGSQLTCLQITLNARSVINSIPTIGFILKKNLLHATKKMGLLCVSTTLELDVFLQS